MQKMPDCGKYNFRDTQTKYYNPIECLAYEIIVLCRGRVIFKQYVPKKHSGFGKEITG
jgi:hypothetical protein